MMVFIIFLSFTERAVLSAISAELQLNFLEARNRELKNFNVKGSRTGLVSPVNVTFNEIGAIPPPRMFSDNNTITLSIRNNDVSDGKSNRSSSDMDVDPMEGMEVTCESQQHRNHFQSKQQQELYHDHPIVTVIDDEAPAKEPKMSAVPVKSALRKSKTPSSSSISVSSSSDQFGSSHSNPSQNNNNSSSSRFTYGIPQRSSGTSSGNGASIAASTNPLTRCRPIVMIRTNNSMQDDSDSDSEDSIRWRDYYGDDERG